LVKVTLNRFGVLVPLLLPFQDVLAVCALEGTVKPSGTCPQVHDKASKSFTGLLAPVPLVKVTLNLFGVFAFPERAC
jgi:hypothetical protein